MRKIFTVLALFLVIHSYAQENKGLEFISYDVIKPQLTFFSSDWFEGREAGMKGAFMASDYLASQMELMGLEKYKGSYFQEFSFLRTKPLNQELAIIKTVNKKQQKHMLVNGFDFKLIDAKSSLEVEAEMVFAGYGIVDASKSYDDYKGIDANGKIVVIIDGYPGKRYPDSPSREKFMPQGYKADQVLLNSKLEIAKEKGAIAIFIVNPGIKTSDWANNSKNKYNYGVYESDKPLSSVYDYEYSLPETGTKKTPALFHITSPTANRFLSEVNLNVENYEKQMAQNATNNPEIIKGLSIYFKAEVESTNIKCRNVVGMIEGKDTTKAIIVGAHYDHLGKYNGWVWNGADDNGSGTIALLTIARAFEMRDEKPENTIIFVSFTGEEKGLLGSSYFAQNMDKSIDYKYMFNMDMISRDAEEDTAKNQCLMIYANYKEELRPLLNNQVSENKLNLDLNFWGSGGKNGGSDHSPFAQQDIPYVFFWCGWTDDYHQPSDEIHKINWEKMLNLTKLGYLHVDYIDKNGIK